MAVVEQAVSGEALPESAWRRSLNRSMSIIDLNSSNDNEVVKLVTFEHSAHLLRGVHLYHVLRRGAEIFGSSAGSASTYGLSREVTRLDAFLSHNWAVGRFGKFAALAFYFNAPLSVIAMLMVASVLGPLTIAGRLPTIQEPSWAHGSGICCRLLGFPLVLLATTLLRDLLSCSPFGGPIVFLDKICIPQVDKDLQKRAIEKLGAFLAKSDTMVVAYTGLCLKKLWTVYEVASFLALHPVSDMRIVPILRALLFFATWLYIYLQHCLQIVARVYIPINTFLLTSVVRIGAGVCLCAVLRGWARERAAIQSRLKTFSVRDCVCAVESDRPIVYSNIARLMVASRRVPFDASEEVALEAFDKLVRSKMPSAFESALGGTAFDYWHWLIVFAMDSGPACLDKLAGVSTSMPLQEAVAIVNYYAIWVCTLFPLAILILEWFSRLFMAFHGWRQWAYLFAVVVAVGVPFSLVNARLHVVKDAASTSTTALAGFLLVNAVGPPVAWGLLMRQRRCHHCCCRSCCGALTMQRRMKPRCRQPAEQFRDAGIANGMHGTDHPIGEPDRIVDSIGRPMGERDGVHEPPSAFATV